MSHQPKHPHLSGAIERNIATVAEVRRQLESATTREDRAADRITAFSGSMPFLYLHAA